VIVEGIYDQVSLEAVIPRLVVEGDVKFLFTKGDITTKNGVNTRNIKEIIHKEIRKFLNENHLVISDIVRIIHIVDTDGAFIPCDCIKHNQNENLLYLNDSIETSNVQNIIERNRIKTSLINKLISTPKLFGKEYEVYYVSRNLEHVLHDITDELENDAKNELANGFVDKYLDHPEDFIAFISDPIFAVEGSIKETWDFIKANTNSLKRFSNLHILFCDITENDA